jgi:hypothetical protein
MRAAVEAGIPGGGLCAAQRNVEMMVAAAKRMGADICIKLLQVLDNIGRSAAPSYAAFQLRHQNDGNGTGVYREAVRLSLLIHWKLFLTVKTFGSGHVCGESLTVSK